MEITFNSVLIVVDDLELQKLISNMLTDEGFTVTSTASVEEARAILRATSISCLVVTDSLALSYGKESEGLFKGLPETIPTLTLIRPSNNSLQAFDQIRRPPFAIHEYLTIPLSLEDVVHLVRKIIEAAT
jgi:DNA-binding NtrC family response regulator